jgi:hypothetical protein
VTELKVPRPLLDEAAAALRASRSFSDRILIVKIWRDLELNFKRVSLSSEERRKHVHGSLHGERERERVSRFYLTSHVLYVFQNHVF